LPSATTNGSEDGAAVFPYIPRKRQERNGLLIEHFYLPAASASGDQVDFLILGESRVGVLLADVSGTVSPGSLPIIKTALRSNSTGLSTAATLRFLDQRLSEICTNGFAITAFYATFDQNKRLLHFASAGHLPMLLYRAVAGKIFLLNTSGSTFGDVAYASNLEANGKAETNGSAGATLLVDQSHALSNAAALKSERVALRQNDLLVLYSDGLLALRNAQGEVFGRQRLVDLVREFGELNPAAFVAELKRTLEKFAGNHPCGDDVSVIVLKNVLRDLDKPHPETIGYDLESRFLTTDEEQSILDILREDPKANAAMIQARLLKSEHAYLRPEQVEAYLAQHGHWLQPWQDRYNGRLRNNVMSEPVLNHNGSPNGAPATKKQFHDDLRTAFPIRQLLRRHYEFHGSTRECTQALRYYKNGDYERALAEFTRLRPSMLSSASMHCFCGNLHLLLNAPTKAQHEYLMALQADPRCVHALLALSYIALLQEDYPAAIDSITTALRLNKNLKVYEQFAEKLIAAVERLENRNEWIV
jgi:tetratricopeptide (TPR) repeat protein